MQEEALALGGRRNGASSIVDGGEGDQVFTQSRGEGHPGGGGQREDLNIIRESEFPGELLGVEDSRSLGAPVCPRE